MEPLDAPAVAHLLHEIGQRLEISGEAPFKARAYYAAAESLMRLGEPLEDVVARGDLRKISGVGEAIAEKIVKLRRTGTHRTLDHLRELMPATVLEMLDIPGLGPKKVGLLYNTLKVKSVEELEAACKDGRVKDCKGLGGALQEKVLAALQAMQATHDQFRLDDGTSRLVVAANAVALLHPLWGRVVPAGDCRRGCEIVRDLCLVAEGGAEDTHTIENIRVVVSEERHYGLALLFATGSAAHLDLLTRFASDKGFVLTPQTLRDPNGTVVPCPDEQDIYAALGLPFIEPELREGKPLISGQNEIELAVAGKLPALLNVKHLRGVLHCHSTFSDGMDSLETMAKRVRDLGYEYFGIADHSKSAFYARGLKREQVLDQHARIDELNSLQRSGFRIFKGIESDILQDGALDYDDDLLRQFDFVVASVHSRFALGREEQTRRVIRAVENPHTTILGHPTGRLLLQRPPLEIDMEAVLEACAARGVAVEINAHPQRLDLDWRLHQRALELGCTLSINPDAHSRNDIEMMHWGVCIARKSGVPRGRVLNCKGGDELATYFARRKARNV